MLESTWKYLFSVVLLLITLLAGNVQAVDSSELNRELLRSLVAKELNAARAALEKGANPEAMLGPELTDHAMCAAIDDSGIGFLELLAEYGASPNAYFDIGQSIRRTPLACSVYLWNFPAFTPALSRKRYPMALRLLQLYELHPVELKRLAYDLENSPYDASHPWNYAREALIEWTRKRVPDFNPRSVNPSPDGVSKECLFTFRDREQGLKKGTLCPRPEDLR